MKPQIETVRVVDLVECLNYLEAEKIIYDSRYAFVLITESSMVSNGSVITLPCFDGRDKFCEDTKWYEDKYIELIGKLWKLYPNESPALQWRIDW